MKKSMGGDILVVLGFDLAAVIISMLDDPADVVRASCVSRSWFKFVILGCFCKSLCLKLFPEVSSGINAIEVDHILDFEVMSNNFWELVIARRKHNVYATLARGLSPILRSDCISSDIYASSTDDYYLEGISNTLEPNDRIGANSSYWSSAGEIDDGVPETLIYQLAFGLCFITEINIRPFAAYFRHGHPVYSAKAVRFRLGYFKYTMNPAHKHYEWTYESPEYQMNKENTLQKFKLPEPVLCIGGKLEVELLGRTQRCLDGKFYICVTHVQVVARTLLPEFEAKLYNRNGNRAIFS